MLALTTYLIRLFVGPSSSKVHVDADKTSLETCLSEVVAHRDEITNILKFRNVTEGKI